MDKSAADLAALQAKGRMLKEEVDEEDIAEVVSKWTGIPVSKMLEGEVDRLIHMEEILGKRVIGQEEAIRAVAATVRRSRAGIQEAGRPIGSFIFLGPTGVGKTELARALAEFLFDDEKAMVRLDMSEYMEKHTVSRLIGAPPGYVGYEEGGQLTEAVKRRPYSIVLLDEIEKAHPDVFNVLLQILDDGRLTDGQGRTVDFKNTIIIMTSNLGSQVIKELSRDYEAMEKEVRKVLEGHFKPEFLNRIDEVIIFKPLPKSAILEIVGLQLDLLAKRLADRKIGLEVDEGGQGAPGGEGLRPRLRRPAAQADDPEGRPESPGHEDPGRGVRGRRHGRDRRRQEGRAHVREEIELAVRGTLGRILRSLVYNRSQVGSVEMTDHDQEDPRRGRRRPFVPAGLVAPANGLNLNGLGSRAQGMGGAFVSIANDFSAVFWNPAGAAGFRQKTFGFYADDLIPRTTYRLDSAPSPRIRPFDAKTKTSHYLASWPATTGPSAPRSSSAWASGRLRASGTMWNGADFADLTTGTAYDWSSRLDVFSFSPMVAVKLSEAALRRGGDQRQLRQLQPQDAGRDFVVPAEIDVRRAPARRPRSIRRDHERLGTSGRPSVSWSSPSTSSASA